MRYGFNLKNEDFIKDIESNDLYQYRLLLNKALMTGDGNVVSYFYRLVAPKFASGTIGSEIIRNNQRSFMLKHRKDNAFVFYGLSKMIVQGIVRLLTCGGAKIGGKHKSRLNDLLKANDWVNKYKEAIKVVSGQGDVMLRVVNDPMLRPHPILEVIDPERYELIIKRGIIMGYIIKIRLEVEKVFYEHHEIYRKIGEQVVIEHKVFEEGGEEVDLKQNTSIVLDIIKSFGLEEIRQLETFPIQVLSGLKTIPIIYISNSEKNKGLRGIADIHGMESIEDALSEELSNMIDEIRKAGLKILIDQSLMQQDENGRPTDYDHFNKDIIVTKSEAYDGSKLVSFVQGDVHSEKYIEASKYLIAIGCNKATIHPISIGITGLESIVASAESQQEREGKTSLRLREIKQEEWVEYIQQLGVIMLEVDDAIKGLSGEYQLDDIKVKYGKYTNPNPESIISVLQAKIIAGVENMKQGIREQHPEYSDEEVDKAYALVKVEKNLPLTETEKTLLGVVEEPIIEPIKEDEV